MLVVLLLGVELYAALPRALCMGPAELRVLRFQPHSEHVAKRREMHFGRQWRCAAPTPRAAKHELLRRGILFPFRVGEARSDDLPLDHLILNNDIKTGVQTPTDAYPSHQTPASSL